MPLTPVGATKELSLRVSVAMLVRVVFQNPTDGILTLALERKATLFAQSGEQQVLIKCQPFGGAVRLRSLDPLRGLVGDFHFDSEPSRSEHDFRVFIRPADWTTVRDFCRQQFENGDELAIESGPERELVEEFSGTIGVGLTPEQFTFRPLRTVVEDKPAVTENVYARGCQTVRVYRIFEARILDPIVCVRMMENSERCSNEDLKKRAIADARRGGKGWANAMLTVPMEQFMEFYLALSPGSLDASLTFGNNLLDANVCAILEGISAPRYRSL